MALDGLLALALVGLGQWELWMTPQADTAKHVGHSVVGVVLAVLVTAPVAVRRRWSRSALALVLIGAYLQAVLSYQDQNTTVFGLLFGVYAVALAHSRWFSIPGALLAAGYPLSRELLINHDAALQFAFALVFVAVIMVTTWVVGDMQRRRLRRIADAERDAERTRRESDARAMRAAEEERTRIARELHDVVAHSLSVIVVQAGAARTVLDDDPGHVRESLLAMEGAGRQTLTEMRRILGVLRKEDDGRASLAPQPTLEHLDLLLEQFERAGLPVELTVEGRVRPLPPTLEVSAYRIAQEALTNTLKHAGPAEARLRLVYGESDLELEVSDNGRGVAADQHRSGYGLVGMRERVRLFGGELEAGPGAGGGFCVRARLSLEARAEPVSSGAGRPEHGIVAVESGAP
jgi:signal transduction histidine kinase